MPYVEGESLRARLDRERQLSVSDAVRITREVGSALDYAHRRGIIHRDIKPETVLLLDGQAMVVDFGIALAASRAGGSRLTETGLSLGTPSYMSPEQAGGERDLDARSDQYSLARMLYEMLAGQPPHTGPTVQAVMAAVLTREPEALDVLRTTVPAHVSEAVSIALAKLPADRFETTAQFLSALGQARRTTGASGRRTTAARGALPRANDEIGDVLFFAPDGKQLGFATGTALRRVTLDGAEPLTIAPMTNGLDIVGAAWTDTGEIDFSVNSVVMRVPFSGGTATRLVRHGADSAATLHSLAALPGGDRVLGVRSIGANEEIGVWWLPFDARSGDTTGPATRIAQGAIVRFEAVTRMAASRTGAVSWVSSQATGALLQVSDTGVSPRTLLQHARMWSLRLSPSAKQLIFAKYDAATPVLADLWIFDVASGTDQRLTSGGVERRDFNDATWSRDGRWFAMSANDSSGPAVKHLYLMPADGSAPPRKLIERVGTQWPSDFSRDGKWVVFTDRPDEKLRSIWIVPVDGSSAPRALVKTLYIAASGRISPAGGRMPMWSGGGSELYNATASNLEVATVSAGAEFTVPARRRGGSRYRSRSPTSVSTRSTMRRSMASGW